MTEPEYTFREHYFKKESTNPKDKIGKTKPPLHLIPASASIVESMAMSVGEKKYGPYNWREHSVSASVYVSAALRHLHSWFDGQNDDAESGVSHLGHVRACMGILIDAEAQGKLVNDRPPAGAAARMIERFTQPMPVIPTLKDMAQGKACGQSAPATARPGIAFEDRDLHGLLRGLGCDDEVACRIVNGMNPAYGARQEGLPYRPCVYIAGPMRGRVDFNFPQFDAARDFFLSKRYNVISPADIDRAAKDTENLTDAGLTAKAKDFLYRDFYAIYLMMHVGVQGENAVAFLPGWESSTGALAEFAIARWLGLKILDATTGGPLESGSVNYSALNRALSSHLASLLTV